VDLQERDSLSKAIAPWLLVDALLALLLAVDALGPGARAFSFCQR
jgi:hypothetical protein